MGKETNQRDGKAEREAVSDVMILFVIGIVELASTFKR